MDGKSPLISMVYDGFWSPKPLVAMVFQWILVQKPLLAMVFQWFWSPKPLVAMVFQWFPMVSNHWSYDGMVTIHRSGLKAIIINLIAQASSWSQKLTWLQAPARSCWCLAPCCWPRLSGTFQIGGRAGAASFCLLNGYKMLITWMSDVYDQDTQEMQGHLWKWEDLIWD